MENNTKKVKNIEAVVIIILSILLIGVLVFLGIRYISKQNMSIINNAISNLDDIYNETNKNNQEENKNDEIEKVKYSKVSDLIKDLVYEKNPIEKKAYENVIYKLDMVLPYFKIQTEVTKQINQEIDKTYKFYTEDYLSKESTQSSSRNTTISYKANMDTEKGILTLEITNAYTDWAGTGAPNGSSITTYKYDYINDKLIEKKEQENKEEVKESAISSIELYKRNIETNKYYEKTIELSKADIQKVEEYIKSLEESESNNIGVDSYKLIIKYKAGTKTVLTIHKNNIVSYDNATYKSTQLEKYIKEIADKTKWIDPYANYKNYEWGTKKTTSQTGAYIEIKSNKVYVTYSNKTSQVKNVSGTPIKTVSIIGGGIPFFYILTEEGKVYNLEEWDTEATLVANLSKYDVIDMTTQNLGVVYRGIYYLTSDGKLIDENGDTFEDLNKNFTQSFGNLNHIVYLDSNSYVYYSKKGDANYIIIKDNDNNKVKANKIYMQQIDDTSTIIILTKDNQIIYISNDGKISQEKSKVTTFRTYSVYDQQNDTFWFRISAKMENNENITKDKIQPYYYDLEKGQTVE